MEWGLKGVRGGVMGSDLARVGISSGWELDPRRGVKELVRQNGPRVTLEQCSSLLRTGPVLPYCLGISMRLMNISITIESVVTGRSYARL